MSKDAWLTNGVHVDTTWENTLWRFLIATTRTTHTRLFTRDALNVSNSGLHGLAWPENPSFVPASSGLGFWKRQARPNEKAVGRGSDS